MKDFNTFINENESYEDLVKEVERLRKENVWLKSQLTQKSSINVNQPTNQSIKYADSIWPLNGVPQFSKVTDNQSIESIYKLTLISNRKATFIINTDDPIYYKQILRNADKADGCEKHIITRPPTNLDVTPGEAELNDMGKWIITKKAIVKLI